MSQDRVLENISLQLAEVDMLQSMFPNEEFQLDDPTSVPTLQACIDGEANIAKVDSRIGFSLKLETMESKEVFELVTHFPREYPAVLPEFFVRFKNLPSAAHKLMTEDLQSYVRNDLVIGEICMCFVIEWLKENTEKYIKLFREHNKPKKDRHSAGKEESKFSRMWIYSHHIYSKIKRKDILEYASELRLTGFSMPGKPGIIAIEGYNRDVEEFWGRIRRMQWKRIVMKEKEDFHIEYNKDVDDYRKFDGFEEKNFEPRQSKHRGAYGDRGLLYQFLEEKGCAHIFRYYFGVEGKPIDHDSD